MRDDSGVTLHWRPVKDEEFPDDALDPHRLKVVYSDVPYKTEADVRSETEKYVKQARAGYIIVFVWVAVVPAAWAIVEWADPWWLGTGVMIYGVYKAFIEGRKLLGRSGKSQREKEEGERELRKQHYFYHCERNPEGFARLKVENFEREARENVQRSAATLKQQRRTRLC